MAHRRCFSECHLKTVLNFVSAVLVPIVIAIFSIILALQQKSIAETNRDVDLRITADQHRQNVELALDGQRDAKLVAYMNEISHLLLTNNFSLSKRILTSIVRPKTLAVLRQIDVTRKGYLIQFLRESRMISTTSPPVLSLAGADLNDIDLSEHEKPVDMRQVSFFGASLDDASFTRVSLGYIVILAIVACAELLSMMPGSTM
ncbi:unnamed protein product [Rotaria sp. Silwood2]|nr:unnamed protein product [Rotaria sp. Silwood2]CAF2955637.1 unnamed protein product [Rotaria sp. Silwood2]CAF3320966.1 unnamed protein product [Rotaria sp. Silwood2]CAF4076934.1 unnamed protein product [Rotaria sp. Silwood2]CAF4307701.1 unnamed protein product [Rotaria sp. Silwood2]